jgi:FkbM family methyltransferase
LPIHWRRPGNLGVLRRLGRLAFRTWARTGIVPGYYYRAVEAWGPLLAGDGPETTTLPNGCAMECDLEDHVGRLIYFRGTYEFIEAFLFTRLLTSGMVVIDAGANIGQYTMLASTAVTPTGRVHSFEPVHENYSRLRAHVAANGLTNVRLNRLALWSEDSTLVLVMPNQSPGNHGSYTVRQGAPPSSGEEAPGIRLDEYASANEIAGVDLIKMDIEGAEAAAILGGLGLVERCRPIFLLEVNRAALTSMGSSPNELWELVSGLGYRAWRIGWSPETSGPVSSFEGLVQSNVFLHYKDLPSNVTSGWSYDEARRWAYSGWWPRRG